MNRQSKNHTLVTVGSIFSYWKVLKAPTRSGSSSVYRAKCECVCGKVKFVRTSNLLNNRSKSCGCVQRAQLPLRAKGKQLPNRVDDRHLATTQLINQYKYSAKVRNLKYSLSRKEFESFIDDNCAYCGIGPSNVKKMRTSVFRYNGIDRWDNSLGYELNNCVTCCTVCNRTKNDFMDGATFFEHIQKIQNNSKISFKLTSKKITYYFARTFAAAQNSPDSETKVGAILVDKITGAVVAEGYNGFIRGASDKTLPTTRPDKYDYMIHAETNMACNAVNSGVCTNEKLLFCDKSPCKSCLRLLWQAGICEIYFKEKYKDFDECTNMNDIEISISKLTNAYYMTIAPKNA